MTRHLFRNIVLMLILVLFQVLVLQGMTFMYAVPLIYIYVLLIWPSETPVWQVLLLGFVLGLSVDILSDTLGINAFATTTVAYMRHPLLRRFAKIDNLDKVDPGVYTLGFPAFWKYASVMLLTHHFLVCLLEYFSVFNPLLMLGKFAFSTVLTIILIALLERFRQ